MIGALILTFIFGVVWIIMSGRRERKEKNALKKHLESLDVEEYKKTGTIKVKEVDDVI